MSDPSVLLRRGQETRPPAVIGRVSYRNSNATDLDEVTVTLIGPSGRQVDTTVADSAGHYALSAPSAGTYTVVCMARGRQPAVSAVTLTHQRLRHDVVLDETHQLAGTIRSTGTHAGVAGALVMLTDAGGNITARTVTSPCGAYQLFGLGRGTYLLIVAAASFRPHVSKVTLPDPSQSDCHSRWDIELSPPGRIEGTIRNPGTGEPLEGVRVILIHDDGNVADSVVTDADGSYTASGLPVGDYTVIATHQFIGATSVTVTGTPITLDVTIHPSSDPSA